MVNQKKAKVCVTTYIWGDRYQEYVPIAIYSMKKMYPDYDVILFLHDTLNVNLKNVLKQLNLLNQVIIKENVFKDCPNMNANKAMAFRWVLWDDCFWNYDYLYIIDIDMFYIKEPLDLHIQHEYHMQHVTHLPFDNMRRIVSFKSISIGQHLFETARFIKNFGVRYLFSFIVNRFHDIKMISGLHFIDVKKYFEVLTPKMLNSYKMKIYDGSYIKGLNTVNNEAFLYIMLKNAGFDVDRLASQNFKNTYEHMDFNNYDKPLFRPTHGIHLGDYRLKTLSKSAKEAAKTSARIYYKNYMVNILLKDPEFHHFLEVISDDARLYFTRLFKENGIKYQK